MDSVLRSPTTSGFQNNIEAKSSAQASLTQPIERHEDVADVTLESATLTPNTSILSKLKILPKDPILGVNDEYKKDVRSHKVNLGVGVYSDENGVVPVLKCVTAALKKIEAKKAKQPNPEPHNYLPIDGFPEYNKAVRNLLFGADSDLVRDNRVVTMQAFGGTGGLKLGVDLLKEIAPDSHVWISNPSWENHRNVFEKNGFSVSTYPYFNPETHGVDFDGMLGSLKKMTEGSVVLLHACCHNPTGADLTDEQWSQVIDVVKERKLIPFLDMAYQGFAKGIEEDGEVVRSFAKAGVVVLVSNSFSKSFSAYNDRVGAFSIVTANAFESEAVISNLKPHIRANYSSPSKDGVEMVSTVLNDPVLCAQWREELEGMRLRIKDMRELFVAKLKERGHDFSFVLQQTGMFSYSGLSKEQAMELRLNHAIYILDTGRICLAALNEGNIDQVVDAICKVIK